MNVEELNKVSLSLSKRAENSDDDHLSRTFVSVGNIPTLLSNTDSAIIFGRRGTGKTHLLAFKKTATLLFQ
jgi:DNA replication protein DnaC